MDKVLGGINEHWYLQNEHAGVKGVTLMKSPTEHKGKYVMKEWIIWLINIVYGRTKFKGTVKWLLSPGPEWYPIMKASGSGIPVRYAQGGKVIAKAIPWYLDKYMVGLVRYREGQAKMSREEVESVHSDPVEPPSEESEEEDKAKHGGN